MAEHASKESRISWLLTIPGIIIFSGITTVHSANQVSLETVCNGDDIPLFVQFTHPESSIIKSKFYKANNGHDNLMIKDQENQPTIFCPRVSYHGPTEIIIKNGSANDSGSYETDVVFEDQTKDWHRFLVNVSTGCPEKARFHRPDIKFKLEGSSEWVPLKKQDTVILHPLKTITLNISIPEANPPVTCTIKGQNPFRKLGSEKPYFFYRPFFYDTPGNYSIAVKLEHAVLNPASLRTIRVQVIDVTTLLTTTTRQKISEDVGTEIKEKNNGAMLYIMVTTIVILAALVAVLIIYVLRIKKHIAYTKRKQETTHLSSSKEEITELEPMGEEAT